MSTPSSAVEGEPRIPAGNADGVRALLRPLLPCLEREGVTDLVINKPGEIGVEVRGLWEWKEEPELHFQKLLTIARGLAGLSRQEINERLPIVSAVLPDGQRVQVLIPPATLPNTVSMTVRRPPTKVWTLAELEKAELFRYSRAVGPRRSRFEGHEALLMLFGERKWAEFLRLAVTLRMNIVISGATGSGKTSLARALLACIPAHERVVTGEDTHELVNLPHRNKVHLLYPQDKSQAVGQIGARELMTAALRMRPDRIIFPELRDGTAYYFLRSVASGHPGVITTVHAASAETAWETLTLLVRECEEARGLDRQDVRGLLGEMVDVVVQMERNAGRYQVTEILYDPVGKWEGTADGD
jgi:type IV secretion system protein VirB11